MIIHTAYWHPLFVPAQWCLQHAQSLNRLVSESNSLMYNMHLFHTSSGTKAPVNRVWLAACTVVVVLVLVLALMPSPEKRNDAHIDPRRALNEHESLALVLQRAAEPLKSRICGKPAVDGYITASPG